MRSKFPAKRKQFNATTFSINLAACQAARQQHCPTHWSKFVTLAITIKSTELRSVGNRRRPPSLTLKRARREKDNRDGGHDLYHHSQVQVIFFAWKETNFVSRDAQLCCCCWDILRDVQSRNHSSSSSNCESRTVVYRWVDYPLSALSECYQGKERSPTL